MGLHLSSLLTPVKPALTVPQQHYNILSQPLLASHILISFEVILKRGHVPLILVLTNLTSSQSFPNHKVMVGGWGKEA